MNYKKIIFVNKLFKTMPIINCEIADTYQKKVIGVQKYNSLDINTGMVFPYLTPQSLAFHMGQVSFPIDIIFTHNNKIVKICHNCKPGSQDIYSCDNASNVIEVIGNFCAFHSLESGDHVFSADDKESDFIQHIIEKVRDIKVEQQKDLDMTEWNIKIVMVPNPHKRFLSVDWEPDDYDAKKAEIIVNPNQQLVMEELKHITLDKLVRHSLLHILAGEKGELPEDDEYRLITTKLFKDARDKKVMNIINKYGSINIKNKL